MAMDEKAKAVFAALPPLKIKHPAKFSQIKAQWGHGPAQILADAHLPRESAVQVLLAWWAKAGVTDFCLGYLVYGAARSPRPPQTDEQKADNAKKQLRKRVYTAPIPELKAVMTVANQRIETAPRGTGASLAQLDALDDDPGSLFTDFIKRIDEQAVIEYQPVSDYEVSESTILHNVAD